MKTELQPDGFIKITAENTTEAFALYYLTNGNCICDECGMTKTKILFDMSILMKEFDNE